MDNFCVAGVAAAVRAMPAFSLSAPHSAACSTATVDALDSRATAASRLTAAAMLGCDAHAHTETL